jgi:hypothetical protein
MRERDALLTDKNNLTQQLLALTAQLDLLAALQAQNEHLNAEAVVQSQELSQLRIQQAQTEGALTKLKQEFALAQTQIESDKANLQHDLAAVQQQNAQLLQQQRDMTAANTRQLQQAEADKMTLAQLSSKLLAADKEVARLTTELENTVQAVLIKSQGMMLLQDRISELEHELLEVDKKNRAVAVAAANLPEDSVRGRTASSAVARPAPPPPPGPPPQFAIEAGERLGTLRPDVLVAAATMSVSGSDVAISSIPATVPVTSQAADVISTTSETPLISAATATNLVAAATSRYLRWQERPQTLPLKPVGVVVFLFLLLLY